MHSEFYTAQINMNKGFTLIEVLVYIALLGIIMTGLLASSLSIFQNTDRTQTSIMVQEEGDFLLAKINASLTGANSITAPAAGNSANTLTFIKNGITVTFALSSTDLQLSGTTLNNANVQILPPAASPTFLFTHGINGSSEYVNVRFTLQTKTNNGQTFAKNFETTKYLRK